MSIVRGITYVAAGALALAIAMPSTAKADDWNQKTVFTFSGPVEVPGQVLPAGTYVFKLLDSDSDRNVVEIFNQRENHLYGFFLAIPDYRLRPRGKPIITFEERAAGAPEAIKAWVYPGENYGHQFVYPKVRAMALAQASNQPVPSMPEEMATHTTTTQSETTANSSSVQALKQAPLMAQQPNQQETEVAQAFPQQPETQPATTEPTTTQPSTTGSAMREKALPQTGSALPLIGLLGLLSVGVAGSLRLIAAKMM